jgi:MoaA/NifB/PqqE/SkfB family radical SAM enzyme
MWTTREGPSALTTAEKMRVVNEFSAMNPSGELVLTGGETMAKTAEFFAISGQCRSLGLNCAANTNGSYINESNADQLLAHGPRYIVLSLDSHIPSIHDYARGVPGSHANIVSTITMLVRRRAELGLADHTYLFTNSVVFDQNIGWLLEFVEFASVLGIDGVTFQMLSPTFYRKGATDHFYANHFFLDRRSSIDDVQKLLSRIDEFPIVKTTAQDLAWMQMYIADPDFLGEAVCGSHERNMMINSSGDVQLCFNMKKLLGGRSIGNVRQASLSALWGSSNAVDAREIMSDCRRSCGMLNCHRRRED